MKRLACVLMAIGLAGVAQAQTPAPAPTVIGPPGPGRVTKSAERPTGLSSPVPAAITSAHKLFLSNGGADAGLFPHPFSGTQDRAYGSFYTALSGMKNFELVSSPADADLVLELALHAPLGSIGGNKQQGTEDPLPSFKLIIYDRATHYVLWTITQTIDQAYVQKTHDKNFDDALGLLAGQFALLAGKSS
jgi:hypothetical protein